MLYVEAEVTDSLSRRLQSRMLALAWETWADATITAAIVRQRLKRLQGRRAAAVVNAWAGVADYLRRRHGLAQRASARMRGRTLSAAWNEWAVKAAQPVEEDEDEESPFQVTTTPPHPASLRCHNRTLYSSQMQLVPLPYLDYVKSF